MEGGPNAASPCHPDLPSIHEYSLWTRNGKQKNRFAEERPELASAVGVPWARSERP